MHIMCFLGFYCLDETANSIHEDFLNRSSSQGPPGFQICVVDKVIISTICYNICLVFHYTDNQGGGPGDVAGRVEDPAGPQERADLRGPAGSCLYPQQGPGGVQQEVGSRRTKFGLD